MQHTKIFNKLKHINPIIGLWAIFIASIPNAVFASNCDDKLYKALNPDICRAPSYSFAGVGTASLIGGSAILGGALALISMANASGTNSDGVLSHVPHPTMPTYNMVGGDVDKIQLAGIINTDKYAQNYNQYNDIRLAYSIARGYTGRGTTIAVLDRGLDSWHGATVAGIASGPISPNATVESYTVTHEDFTFLSYREIGNVIKSASQSANVINASWAVPASATDIKSRHDLIQKTDINFVNQISHAAQYNDTIFVWAAGNNSMPESSALSVLPKFMPELNGHFINVVAWDSQTGALADYSNACGITKDWCITAPGNINTGKTNASGTSFAAPIVSSAIAVLREAFPYMNASQITELLLTTARDLGTVGIDEIYGHGMLDLERATRPVGAPLVPLDGEIMQPLQTARISGTIAKQIKSADLQFAFFDEFGRAFTTSLNENISVNNVGRGFMRLRNWQPETSVQLGNLELGMRHSDYIAGDGFLKTENQNLTSFIGWHNKFNIGDIEITQRTNIGFGTPQATPDSMISGFSNIYTASIGISAQYQDWKISIASPDTIIGGKMYLHLPIGRASNGNIIYNDYAINLVSRPAIEYSVQYKFLTGTFIDNPYGTDEFFIMAKTKFQF